MYNNNNNDDGDAADDDDDYVAQFPVKKNIRLSFSKFLKMIRNVYIDIKIKKLIKRKLAQMYVTDAVSVLRFSRISQCSQCAKKFAHKNLLHALYKLHFIANSVQFNLTVESPPQFLEMI